MTALALRNLTPEREAEIVRRMNEIADTMMFTEKEVLRLRLGDRGQAVVSVSGPCGPKQLRQIIRFLEVQAEIMEEDDA